MACALFIACESETKALRFNEKDQVFEISKVSELRYLKMVASSVLASDRNIQSEEGKLIPIEEKLNTLFNKSLIPSPTKLQYPIEEKFKDNKYNINKYKNTNNKRLCNFEQREYEKEGFDWNSLYANNNFTS